MRQHARLIFDEVQDVGQKHPVDERGELEGGTRDVCDDEIDALYATQRRQRFGVVVDGVDMSGGAKSLEQRLRERPVARTDVSPGAALVADRGGDEADGVARVQAAAGVAGTFARPRYARNSMMPLMMTCGIFNRTFPMTSVPWNTPVTR